MIATQWGRAFNSRGRKAAELSQHRKCPLTLTLTLTLTLSPGTGRGDKREPVAV